LHETGPESAKFVLTATPSLTMTQIRKLLVAIPSNLDEQAKIAQRIFSARDALNSLEAQAAM
jgi:restriction endonuclease S subunit